MAVHYTRRLFLGRASLTAVSAGAVAVGGIGMLATESAGAAVPTAPVGPALEGSGVIAHVVDAKAGLLSLFVGTREIRVTDRALAQQLLRATHASPASSTSTTSLTGGR